MTEGKSNGIGASELRRLTRENTLAGAAARNLFVIKQRTVLYWSALLSSYAIIVIAFLIAKSRILSYTYIPQDCI